MPTEVDAGAIVTILTVIEASKRAGLFPSSSAALCAIAAGVLLGAVTQVAALGPPYLLDGVLRGLAWGIVAAGSYDVGAQATARSRAALAARGWAKGTAPQA